MGYKTNTTEKTKKGDVPSTFRIPSWQHDACEFIAEKNKEETFVETRSSDVKKAMFTDFGFAAFCEARNFPTTEEEWKKLLKESIAEIKAE